MSHNLGGYPVDVPDATPRVLAVGSRVLAGSTIIFFCAFVFAYAYLKLLDTHGSWNRGHEVSIAYGSVVLATALLSAIAYGAAIRQLRDDDTTGWQATAAIALAGGLATVALHVWQLDDLSFAPMHSGYTSVFVAWTVALVAVELGSAYWLFTLLRGSMRVAGVVAPEDDGSPARVAHLAASARGYWLFLRVLVAVEILAFVLLVLVR